MELREAGGYALEVPNEWLPESYHTERPRTLNELEREHDRRQTEKRETIHAERKASKAELIEVYAAQVERGEELFAA